MITIFNRRELFITYDMAEQARVRDLLAANGVDYTMATMDRTSPNPISNGTRARAGTFGERPEAMIRYRIYVKKADFERARRLMAEG